MKNNGNDKKGFSLISVMVALGLIGLLSVGMMKMTKIQMKASKNFETINEINSIHAKLNQYLLDSKSCEQTFSSLSFSGSSLVISSIKNKKGNDVYVKGNLYGNNTVKIVNMILTPNDGTSSMSILDGSSKDFILEIRYKKNSKITAQNTIKKKIKLNFQKNNTGTLTCYSQLNNSVKTAIYEACQDIGGNINTTGHCDITASLAIKKVACSSVSGTFDSTTGVCGTPITTLTQKSCTAMGGVFNLGGTSYQSRCTIPNPPGLIVTLYNLGTCPTGTTEVSRYWDFAIPAVTYPTLCSNSIKVLSVPGYYNHCAPYMEEPACVSKAVPAGWWGGFNHFNKCGDYTSNNYPSKIKCQY